LSAKNLALKALLYHFFGLHSLNFCNTTSITAAAYGSFAIFKAALASAQPLVCCCIDEKLRELEELEFA